jgi:hypothetical protein
VQNGLKILDGQGSFAPDTNGVQINGRTLLITLSHDNGTASAPAKTMTFDELNAQVQSEVNSIISNTKDGSTLGLRISIDGQNETDLKQKGLFK